LVDLTRNDPLTVAYETLTIIFIHHQTLSVRHKISTSKAWQNTA